MKGKQSGEANTFGEGGKEAWVNGGARLIPIQESVV